MPQLADHRHGTVEIVRREAISCYAEPHSGCNHDARANACARQKPGAGGIDETFYKVDPQQEGSVNTDHVAPGQPPYSTSLSGVASIAVGQHVRSGPCHLTQQVFQGGTIAAGAQYPNAFDHGRSK